MRASPWFAVLVVALVAACSASPGGTFSPATSAPQPTATVGTGPAVTPAATPAITASPTAVPPTQEPSVTLDPIALTDVECLAGQTVRFHVRIMSGTGIASYELWSTWGGGGRSTVISPTPLPTNIEVTVEFTHEVVDPEPGRAHQFGLAVMLDGATDPILTYAYEPDGRCPGH